MYAVLERYGFTASDRGIGLASTDFDLSVFDIFGLLSIGASLVIVPELSRQDPAQWLSLCRRHQVTVWNSAPALMDVALTVGSGGDSLMSLKKVLLSGDWIPVDLPKRIRASVGRDIIVLAMGGATEASVWSNAFEADNVDDDWKSIPYGYPLPNQKYRVVNDRGEDCPDMVAGELWIGGKGVAIGYLGDFELTKERFVWADDARWYRTGDLGRYWSDGTLEFLGRLDAQIKMRSFRVEPGEVEAALERIHGINAAIVLPMGEGQRLCLVAAVSSAEEGIHDETSLKEQLGLMLPDYMIPQTILFVPSLPLSGNGKVDRRAIMEALQNERDARDDASHVLTDDERRLKEIWCDVLGISSIGVQDSFFRCGGNSLQAVRVLALMEAVLPVRVSLGDFLKVPTISGVLSLVSSKSSGREDIVEGVV